MPLLPLSHLNMPTSRRLGLGKSYLGSHELRYGDNQGVKGRSYGHSASEIAWSAPVDLCGAHSALLPHFLCNDLNTRRHSNSAKPFGQVP